MFNFYSQANQDEFVYNILNKQSIGTFVDIGSNDPINFNNSYFLETIGWSGICIDLEKYDYTSRRCKFYQTDALKINYPEFFEKHNMPSVIDYLSLDIDYYSTECLKKLLLSTHRYKVITIEHDSYRYNDLLKSEQNVLLFKMGYDLLCENVTCVPLRTDQYFEDWWVDSKYIDIHLYNKIKCKGESCVNIIKKFKF